MAGRASVGVEIPPDYARQRLNGEPADVLVLIDGSDSSISSAGARRRQRASPSSRSLAELAQRAGAKDLPDPRAPAAALQSRLAQREPPDPRARRDPADLLGHAARGVRDRPRTRARDARAAHGDAGLAGRGRARKAPALPRPGLRAAALRPVPHDRGLPRADPRQPPAAARPLGRLPLRAPLARPARLLAGEHADGGDPARADVPAALRSCCRATSSRSRRCPGPLRVFSQVLPATHFIAISRGIIIRGAVFARPLAQRRGPARDRRRPRRRESTRAFHKTIS